MHVSFQWEYDEIDPSSVSPASSTDVLWAVNTSGQLVRCSSRHLFRRQDSADPLIRHKVSSSTSEDGDWELV